MFTMEALGRWLMVIGVAVALVGVVVFLLSKVPFLDQLGRLPGDIVYESPNKRVSVFVPIVSSVLISLILTIVLNIILRILRK